MKKLILLFLFMLSCMTTFADWVEIDGIVYELDNYQMTAEVSGNIQKYSGDIVIPSTISCDGMSYTVTRIGYQAFYFCNELTSVTIPNTVYKIGNYAFKYCSKLEDMYCYAFNVPNLGRNVFEGSNVGNATLHVPESSLNEYKSADQWMDFGSITYIEEDPLGIEQLKSQNLEPITRKYLHNGRIVIERNAHLFNANGQNLK